MFRKVLYTTGKRLAVAEMACKVLEVEGKSPWLPGPGILASGECTMRWKERKGGGEEAGLALRITWPDDSFQQGDSPSQELQLGLLL